MIPTINMYIKMEKEYNVNEFIISIQVTCSKQVMTNVLEKIQKLIKNDFVMYSNFV